MSTDGEWEESRVSFPLWQTFVISLPKKSQSIEQPSLLKEAKTDDLSQCCSFFGSTFGGFVGHPSPIHHRSEVKGAVTSTRRLMKIAGLGLFIVIFVFVARRFFFVGSCRFFFFGNFGFWENEH